MNFTAVVSVSLKDSILDPAGRVLLDSLGKLGYDTVTDVRAGKQFRLSLRGERSEVEAQLAEFANGAGQSRHRNGRVTCRKRKADAGCREDGQAVKAAVVMFPAVPAGRTAFRGCDWPAIARSPSGTRTGSCRKLT